MRIAVFAAAVAAMIWSSAAAEPPSAGLFADKSEGLRPLILRRTLFDIPEGAPWLQIGSAALCDSLHRDAHWKAGAYSGDVGRLAPIFDEEIRSAGMRGASDNLFEHDTAPGTLVVGAVVKNLHVRSCGYPDDRLFYHIGATMEVEWQVYDPLRKEVIAKTPTSAIAPEVSRTGESIDMIIAAAFRMNARAFLARPEIIQLAHAQVEDREKRVAPTDRSTLLLAFAKPTKTPIAQAAGSVVTVLVDGGHGSGFLISPDGYLLTNHHVVGDAKLVRIRWSDGFETEGEVLRSDKRRDVALVKSSAHSRQPLFLRRPLAHTVTRGVVSAYRVDGGLNFLQSDVGINHGNSGGPLLDENGAVIGIAVSGLFLEGTDAALGINRFIPIGDALDFLAIKAAP
jgi:serine protease Do